MKPMKDDVLQFFAPTLPPCPEGCHGSHCHCQSCGQEGVPLTDDDVCEVCVLTEETCPDELPSDLGFWHDWLVHSDGSTCEDGCSKAAIPTRAQAYLRLSNNLWRDREVPDPDDLTGKGYVREQRRQWEIADKKMGDPKP